MLGAASFKSASMRSSRVTSSPSARAKAVTPAGPAQRREQQITGRVVTHGHGGRAYLRERHAVAAGAVLGNGRIDDDVARLEPDAPVEALPAGVDAGQNGAGREQLERAAQRKAFVGPVDGERAGLRVADGDAEAAAAVRRDLREVSGERFGETAGRVYGCEAATGGTGALDKVAT